MAKDLLVGSTGFVGGNLAAKHAFAAVCHSTDIAAQFGAKPDLCVYAGVPAAMFLANADPDADLAVMAAARENLRQIAPKQLVLISSIAVYADSRGKDEQSPMTPDGLPAYGRNRLQLERWVWEDYPNALIVRLPALYGIGLKKNFLFDLHTITPAMLKPEKYDELAAKSTLVQSAYTLADNGFYKLNGTVDAAALKAFFAGNDFNALAFTDSRSRYQFYNLGRLWPDLEKARAAPGANACILDEHDAHQRQRSGHVQILCGGLYAEHTDHVGAGNVQRHGHQVGHIAAALLAQQPFKEVFAKGVQRFQCCLTLADVIHLQVAGKQDGAHHQQQHDHPADDHRFRDLQRADLDILHGKLFHQSLRQFIHLLFLLPAGIGACGREPGLRQSHGQGSAAHLCSAPLHTFLSREEKTVYREKSKEGAARMLSAPSPFFVGFVFFRCV